MAVNVLVKTGILISILVIGVSVSIADDLDPHYKFSGVKASDSPYKNTWGAYQTNLFSGSFSYDYKIAVPPGTNGLAPEISISYNSHSAKGKAGWVGAGWEIPLSYIQRDIEYTRKDTSDDTFDLFLEGAKHDLVYVASESLYHTKVEAYLRIEKKTGAPNETGEYWVVQTKDGTEYRFGYNTDSENRVRASDTSVPGYVWRWSLDRIKDSNGNCIYFNYVADQGSVYLDTITYNNDGKRTVQFIREAKPDAYLMIEQGSEVYDAYRLSEIQIKVNGALARKYKLSYVMNEVGSKSLLSSITQYGDDGVSALPPVRFEYKTADKGFNEGINWATPGEKRIRKTDDDNDTVIDTFDVNGDGLPDFVTYDGSNYLWNIWFNNKNGFASSNVAWAVPSSPDGGWDIRDVEQYIPGEQSPDTRSAPMDLNNDGYVDFLWSDHTNIMRFKLNNNGTGFSSTTYSWTLPVSKACVREVVRPDGTNPNVKQDYSDINGDGLPDLVKKASDTTWQVWKNTGSGFAAVETWPVPHTDAWLEDYTTGDPTELQTGRYDINGDGLVDIVDAHSAPWKIYLNTGSNFLPAQQRATVFAYINDTNSSGDIKRDFIDMNGDGLPDIVNPVSGVQTWEVYFNTGKGFSTKMSWPVPAEVPQNGYVNNIEDSQVGRDVFDINGDGLADLVRHIDSVSYWRVYLNKSVQADLLTKVTDTLGGQIDVSYTPSMLFTNTRLPFNYWLVSSITTNNGMSDAHANVSTTNFSYANGLYDFPTREFRGFGQVNETKADSSKVIHYYYQDEAKKGKEYKTEIKNAADAPFATSEKTWSEPPPANGVYITNLSQTDEYAFDGTPTNPKIIRKEFQNYDVYGNVGLQINLGDLNSLGDETYTYNEYWYSCSSDPWIVDRIKHSYIKASPGGANLRESFFWNDGLTTCAAKGNLTKEEHWLNTGSNPITYYEYDSYGNRKKTIDPEGRITSSIFDPAYNTFPVQVTNAKNQTTSKTFDPVSGQALTETDPDLSTWSYAYDRVGNLISQTDARGITTNIQYDPLNRKTLIDYPNDTDVQLIYDRETMGTLSQITDSTGIVTYLYDQRLRKTEETRALDSLSWTTAWNYDSMDRVTRQTYPDGAAVDYTYDPQANLESLSGIIPNIDYNASGQMVRKDYANGKSTIYSYNSANRRLESILTNGIQNLVYTYDNVGNIKTLQDGVEGKTETFPYDDLDRLTQAGDSGYSEQYQYNAIGNMLSMTKDGKNYGYSYGLNAGPHAVTGMSVPYLVLSSFVLDNGNEYTTTGHVTLNNIAMGNPTEYMASEDANFTGAAWQPYSQNPAFNLSAGHGLKTVYLKVRNAEGVSKVRNDRIDYLVDTEGDGIPNKYDSDDDNDGIPDAWEDQHGLNPLEPSDAAGDIDGDSLTNLLEYQHGTDPADGDTDDDGWNDYEEIFVHHSNPLDADTDDDGLNDSFDPFPLSIYHYGVSENYSMRKRNFNEGGDRRFVTTLVVHDAIGTPFNALILEVWLPVDNGGDGYPSDVDCDDNDPLEHPNQTWYKDADNDGYSDATVDSLSCERPLGYKAASELQDISGDCDDDNAALNPATRWYPDDDGDGYGNPSIWLQQCLQPAGFVLDNTDYNDNDPNIHPGGPVVRIDETYYLTLQEAYDAASSGDAIACQATSFNEDLYIDLNKTVTLQGGYNNAFTAVTGKTTLNGNLNIISGTIAINDFKLQ